MKGFLKKILGFMGRHKILTVIIVLIVVSIFSRTRNNEHQNLVQLGGTEAEEESSTVGEKNEEADLLTYSVQPYDEYIEGLKDVPSDIEGMSQYDKYMAGLDYKDGSDTDRDGLTDKEEIEIYGTDPLQSSTAGDLYKDGWKVENGYDPLVYLEYMEDITFTGNLCSDEIILEANTPTDLHAVVEDYTNYYSLEDQGISTIYRGYWIYNYGSTVRIDLTGIFDEYGIGYSDMKVWVVYGSFVEDTTELEECKYTKEDDNVIALKYDFDKNSRYIIYITAEKTVLSKLWSGTFDKTLASELNVSATSTGRDAFALVTGFPFLAEAFGKTEHIYYIDLGDDEENEAFLQTVVAYCQEKMAWNKLTTADSGKFTAVSELELEIMLSKLREKMPSFEFKEGTFTAANWIYDYWLIAADTDSTDEVEGIIEGHHTGFDVYVDELPFQNFGSEFAPEGNCAGIAYLTVYLYNNGSLPVTDSCKDISWDLSTDTENATLLDAGLYDYKSSGFVDERSEASNNYLLSGFLSAGEWEFVKMVGGYWKMVNDMVNIDNYVIEKDDLYDWEVTENMVESLDNDKIFNLALLLRSGEGHMVTVYDYFYNIYGDLVFQIYDSNIPQDNREEYTLHYGDYCCMVCKKVERDDGTYGMEFTYQPLAVNRSYAASSSLYKGETSAMVPIDENMMLMYNYK